MQNGLVIVTTLALCNLLIFLALIVIILKARRRRAGSSFKQISEEKYSKSSTTDAPLSKAEKEDSFATVCSGKSHSGYSDYSDGLDDGDKVMQKNELLPID
jgi:hypothetical protein